MTTLMRSAAVAAVGLVVALASLGCDDTGTNGGGGGGGGTTTTSTSSTTTPGATTTTVPGTTTTTIGPSHLECAITWSATNTVTLGALQFDTNYSTAGGQMEGVGDAVVCSKLAGDLVTFNDNDAGKILSAAFVSLSGMVAPTDLMKCNFNTPTNDLTAPVASDFVITIVDATDPDTNPVSATVVVTDINCVVVPGPNGTTTTTPTVTTSTVTTSTTIPPAAGFTISFTMADAVTIGALQFTVNYAAANGEFDGLAGAVACTKAAGDLVTFNDEDANKTLNQAYVSLSGFSGPNVLLANCNFTSNGGTPAPSDFVVTVQDATDPAVTPISPLPTINVGVVAK